MGKAGDERTEPGVAVEAARGETHENLSGLVAARDAPGALHEGGGIVPRVHRHEPRTEGDAELNGRGGEEDAIGHRIAVAAE